MTVQWHPWLARRPVSGARGDPANARAGRSQEVRLGLAAGIGKRSADASAEDARVAGIAG